MSTIDDYDYDDYDHSNSNDLEYSDTLSYHWESAFPAGSGAGEITYGACATEWDEYDMEADLEDEECLAYETSQLNVAETYLSAEHGKTYAVGASGTVGSNSSSSDAESPLKGSAVSGS